MKRLTFFLCLAILLASCTGSPAAEQPIPSDTGTSITLMIDGQASQVNAQGSTVRDVLAQAGVRLRAADLVEPALATKVDGLSSITVTHAHEVEIQVDGKKFKGYTLKQQPVAILADLGFHLGAFDIVTHDENGNITLQRVQESLVVAAEAIPYKTQYENNDALSPGDSKVITAGVPGLEISQKRVASTDGKVLREYASPKVRVSEPVNALVQVSSTSAAGTIKVGSQTYNYWKSLDMYTTSYSPCGQGTGSCSTGTASGMKVAYGVVAVRSFVFNVLAGTQVYIPGYGIATIGDVGGGFPDGRPWIDLAYSDADYVGWSGYHTVYFLGEAPAYDPFGN